MRNKYTFNYALLTIGDIRDISTASTSNDLVLFLAVIARCHKDDIYTLPMSELRNLAQQFSEGLKAYSESLADSDVSDAVRLLKGMFGG